MINKKMEWMNEQMNAMPDHPMLYKILCFLSFRRRRKFSYKDWYIILSILNDQTKEGNEYAMNRILQLYKMNNNKLPEELDEV